QREALAPTEWRPKTHGGALPARKVTRACVERQKLVGIMELPGRGCQGSFVISARKRPKAAASTSHVGVAGSRRVYASTCPAGFFFSGRRPGSNLLADRVTQIEAIGSPVRRGSRMRPGTTWARANPPTGEGADRSCHPC